MPPVARPDRFVVFAGAETPLDVLANDLDLNMDPIHVTQVDGLSPGGTIEIDSPPGGRDRLRLTADATARGSFSVPYTVSDATGLSASSAAEVVVVPPFLTSEAALSDYSLYSDFTALRAADLDADGDLDIIAGSTTGPHLFRNDGGSLHFVTSALVFSGADRIDHADLNGDEMPDLVCAMVYGSSFAIGLSSSPWNHTFSTVATGSITDLILRDEAGQPLDFNRDGRADLVTTSSLSNTMEVRLGNGAGGFNAPRAYTVGFGPLAVRAADLNRDGFTDLVVGTSNFTIDVFMGRTGGEFNPRRSTNTGVIARDMRIFDADQSGGLDIAVLSDGLLSQVVGVLVLRPTGTSGAYSVWRTLSAGGESPASVLASDLNRDGFVDILTTNAADRTRSLYANLGSEGPTIDPVTAGSELVKLNTALAADLDGDQVPDLILGGQRGQVPAAAGGLEVRLNRTPAVCAADFNTDGFIDFFDYESFIACFAESQCPPAPAARTADFNHDAFVDFFDYIDFVEAFETGC